MVWNARSHAAYQGYSHLSGIEMTWSLTMWNHSLLRICRLPDCSGSTPCSSSHLSTSKPKYCLLHNIPASAWPITRASSSLRRDGAIERIGLALARLHDGSEAREGLAHGRRCQVTEPQPDRGRFPCTHSDLIMGGSFGAGVRRVDRLLLSVHDGVVDAVFDVRIGVGRAKEPRVVGLVLGEEQRDVALTVQVALAYEGV